MCVEKENQLDVTELFIALIICSTCFGHLCAHHQELETICVFLISNFRRVLNVVWFLLGCSPASEFCVPTFRNTLFHLHMEVVLWISVPKRRHTKFRRREITQMKAYNYICVLLPPMVCGALVAGCWRSGAEQPAMRSGWAMLLDPLSSNIPHPECIASCPAPDLQQPVTKASHTIGGNNTHIVSSSWWWA